tara:strand:+ start:779 stop:1435 length:657 start_codon:yes stop_codon:yes gene_type:complete
VKPFTFVHIPKTGGETVSMLLGTRKNHHKAKDIGLDGYTFSFVRNPCSRLYSWYGHLRKPLYIDELELTELEKQNFRKPYTAYYAKEQKLVNLGPSGSLYGPLALEQDDFNKWAEEIILHTEKYIGSSHPRYNIGPLATCSEFLCDKFGNLLVKNIYRFENFNEELSKLFKQLDREDLIPKIGISNPSRKPKSGEITQRTKDIIFEYFKEDYERFNYD